MTLNAPVTLTSQRSALVKSLLRWYRTHARSMPWRRTHNPYRILVSEIMLQQTQVHRVLLKYPEFIRRFPNFSILAESSPAEVIRAWAGMGYNSRALRLREIARRVIADHRGKLPSSVEILQTFPGIGRYTANAVACFAFGQSTAVVDTNVRRVFARLFPRRNRFLDDWITAGHLLPQNHAYEWNQALMELGSTVCTSSSPDCSECPFHRRCPSAFHIRAGARKAAAARKPAAIPDRIFRGRIISTLRSLNHNHSIELGRLASLVRPESGRKKRDWFLQLLNGLERDGLICVSVRNKKKYISLPA